MDMAHIGTEVADGVLRAFAADMVGIVEIPQSAEGVGGKAAEYAAQRLGIGERASRFNQQDDAAALRDRDCLTQEVLCCIDGGFSLRGAQAQIGHAQRLHGGKNRFQFGKGGVLLRGIADVGAKIDAGDLQSERDQTVVDRSGCFAAEVV